jgi:SAM-dependent methyltransferase
MMMNVKNYREEIWTKEERLLELPFFYRNLRRFELHRYDVTLKSLLGGEKVLDIGCGDGTLLFALREKYRQVWGVDIDRRAIDRIRELLDDSYGIGVQEADANKRLDFEDGYFDAIVVLGLLPLLVDPSSLLQECRRVLRPGGTLVVQVPNLGFLPNRGRVMLGQLPATLAPWEKEDPGKREGDCLHYFTRSSTRTLLRQEGFEVTKITASGVFAKLRRWWGSLLCGDIIVIAGKQ